MGWLTRNWHPKRAALGLATIPFPRFGDSRPFTPQPLPTLPVGVRLRQAHSAAHPCSIYAPSHSLLTTSPLLPPTFSSGCSSSRRRQKVAQVL